MSKLFSLLEESENATADRLKEIVQEMYDESLLGARDLQEQLDNKRGAMSLEIHRLMKENARLTEMLNAFNETFNGKANRVTVGDVLLENKKLKESLVHQISTKEEYVTNSEKYENLSYKRIEKLRSCIKKHAQRPTTEIRDEAQEVQLDLCRALIEDDVMVQED